MSDAPLTPAVLHILLALSDGPLHGYAIMQRVERDSGIEMGPGTIYGTLQRLEDAGRVEEDEAAPAGDRRRVFRITAEGRRALTLEVERMERLAALARERRAPAGGGT